MSKLPEKYENPIDNLIVNKFCKPVSDYVYKYNIKPNTITTIGLFSGLLHSYYLYYYSFYYFTILYIFTYYCDNLDGYIARKYNQGSKFGAYYDHISDTFKTTIFFSILVYRYNLLEYKFLVFLSILLANLYFVALSCQEKLLNKDSTDVLFMKFIKMLCINNLENYIYIIRLFGCGTMIYYMLFLSFYLWLQL